MVFYHKVLPFLFPAVPFPKPVRKILSANWGVQIVEIFQTRSNLLYFIIYFYCLYLFLIVFIIFVLSF